MSLEIRIKRPLHGLNESMLLEASLEIPQGQFVALTGSSGSGKTTLLRILAGLEHAEGMIRFSDEHWLDHENNTPPQQRQIGFVFQDYALFENMTVEDNLMYVSRDRELIERLLAMTRLGAFRDRYPAKLSGGQKQRVALARAMMRRPRLLLLDEPLSALDPKMRVFLQEKIIEIHREFSMTTIMVSHDVQEVVQMADRVIEMEHGTIVSDRLIAEPEAQKWIGKLLAYANENGEHRLVIETPKGPIEVVGIEES